MPAFPAIIAHRGASHYAPENTLAAIALGWEQGADAAEFDIRLTRDGHVVAHHDAACKRTTGVDLAVASAPLDQIHALDAGAWKHARFAGEKIPALPEILHALPTAKRLAIEIKTGPEIVPALVRDLAAAAIDPARIDFISFHVDALRAVRAALPDHPTFLLGPGSTEDNGARRASNLARLIDLARAAGFTGLDLDHDWPIDAPLAATVRAAGLKLYAYTVNDAVIARRLVAAGIDALTTDRPAWLRAQLGAA